MYYEVWIFWKVGYNGSIDYVDNCYYDEGNNCLYDYDFWCVFGNVDKRVCN